MSHKRNRHPNAPRFRRIPKAKPGQGDIATSQHWYHPTKGWRKSRPAAINGKHMIEALLLRAFR